jgi:hypothetical protein
MTKNPILKHKVRLIPKSFSWIDHRLVRDRHMEKMSHAAAALYLFLVCVGDTKGLSYYGDPAVMRNLSMTPETLGRARDELICLGLIAWRRPLYQVLDLTPDKPVTSRTGGAPMNLGDIMKKAMEGTP